MESQDRSECLLSVIIPFLDDAGTLKEIIRCLPRRDGRVEIILVDDGSTDGSRKLAEDLVVTVPDVVLLFGPGRGPGPARNLGMQASSGRYIAFVDADDQVFWKSLLRLAEFADSEGADVVISGVRWYFVSEPGPRADLYQDGPDPVSHPTVVAPENVVTSRLAVWGKLYRTDFLRQHAISFPDVVSSEDVPFSCAVACAQPKTYATSQATYAHLTGTSRPHLTLRPEYETMATTVLKQMSRTFRLRPAKCRQLAAYSLMASTVYLLRRRGWSRGLLLAAGLAWRGVLDLGLLSLVRGGLLGLRQSHDAQTAREVDMR